jgi:NitT/TauT family transport system substrate-binding protein
MPSRSFAAMLSRVVVLACVGLALPMLTKPVAAQETDIVVGLGFSVDHLPLMVAKEKGMFDKAKLRVTLKNIPVPANIGPALVSGDIHVGAATAVSFLLAREAGLKFTALSGQTRNDRNNVTQGLVTRKEISVTKPEHLKGKKVAVPGLNSGGYVLLAKWLVDGGVPLNQVTFIEMAMPSMGDLLRTKSADAAMLPDPFRTRIVEGGAGDFSVPIPAEVSADSINIFWMGNEEWAQKNAAAVRAFRAALGEAMEFIRQDPNGVREIEKKYIGFNNPKWPTFSTRIVAEDIAFYHAIGRQIGTLKKDMDPAGLIQ